MNAGKLVAEIAVIAILAYCCYSAVLDAVPLDQEDMQNPISMSDPVIDITPTSGLEMQFRFKVDITSNLPQDVEDVKFAMYLGSGENKIKLTEAQVGAVVSKSTTTLDSGAVNIPTYAIMAYGICSVNEDGTVSVPLCTQIAFKYFKWQESHLVDLSLTIKTAYPMDCPVIPVFETSGTTSSVTLDIKDDDGIYKQVADYMKSKGCDDVTLTVGGADVNIQINTVGGNTSVAFKADGADGKNAYTIMQEYLDAHESLDLTYGGDTYSLDKENAQTFISLIEMMYGKGSA